MDNEKLSPVHYPLSTIHYPLIDIHTHILPGLDDGAKDIETSLAMAQVAVRDGITMLVATPHVIRGSFENAKEDILASVALLNKSLKEAGIPLPVIPGAEYYLEPDLPRRMDAGKLLTINNSGLYLMVELPSSLIPEHTERVLYELQLQGVTPIIAHPERNMTFARYPELLKSYTERGILSQVTSTSITGLFGKHTRKTALKFLQAGLAHFIASDGHSHHGRAPLMSTAFKELERRWGTQYGQTLAFENPHRIIIGQRVPPTPQPKEQSIWNRFRE